MIVEKGILYKGLPFSGSLLLLHPETMHKSVCACFAHEWHWEDITKQTKPILLYCHILRAEKGRLLVPNLKWSWARLKTIKQAKLSTWTRNDVIGSINNVISSHRPKKGPASLLWRGTISKKKTRANNVIAKVIGAVAKVYSCKKNWGITGTLKIGKRLAKHALDGKKHGRIEDELSHSKCHFCFDIRALWRALTIATLNHQVLKNQQQSFNNQG